MTDPTPPPSPLRLKAELAQTKANTAANESLVRHHEDYRTWVTVWDDNAALGRTARRQEYAAAIRRDALNAAMSWLRDTERTGLRFKPDESAADVDELLGLAERFEAWMTGGGA